jgi:hypothetical protein
MLCGWPNICIFRLVGQVYTQEEVWSHRTRLKAQKGYNFLSGHWITLKFLHEFLEVVFSIIDTVSLRGPSDL